MTAQFDSLGCRPHQAPLFLGGEIEICKRDSIDSGHDLSFGNKNLNIKMRTKISRQEVAENPYFQWLIIIAAVVKSKLGANPLKVRRHSAERTLSLKKAQA